MSVSTKSYKGTRDRISVKYNDIKPHFNESIHKGSFQEKNTFFKEIIFKFVLFSLMTTL